MPKSLHTITYLLRALPALRRPEDVLAATSDTLAALDSISNAVFFSPCAESTSLCVAASAGHLSPQVGASLTIMHSQKPTCLGAIWQSSDMRYFPTMTSNDAAAFLLPDTARSALLLPLKQGANVQLLLLLASDERDAFDSNRQELLVATGETVMLAVHNTRLAAALQVERVARQHIEDRYWTTIRKTETLYHISRSLNEPHLFEEVLQEVVHRVANALHADQIMLVTLDLTQPAVHHFVVGGPDYEQIVPLSFDELQQGLTGRVLNAGIPAFWSKAEAQIRATEHGLYWYKGLHNGSLAVAPLLSQHGTFGVLVIVNHPEHPDFAQADVDLLTAISGQIATAVQSADLFQTIAEERSRLGAVVQSSRDGIILLGLNMHVLVINRPALDFLRLPGDPASWLNQWFWDALSRLYEHSPHAVDVILSEVRRVQSGNETTSEGELHIGPLETSSTRIIHWFSLPVQGDERTVGRLFVLRDITEARLLERFRDDLTHTMVHDLRNPLAGIYAGLKLLSADYDGVFARSQHRILAAAERSTQQMLRLVGAILDINRLESGKMPLQRAPFALDDVVNDVLTMQQPLAKQQKLTLARDIASELPPVYADHDLIERVIQNLIGNALKFTPEGGTVRISAHLITDPEHKIQVFVSDTGHGIAAEIYQRLFQKFVTGTHRKRGNGLGLALCRMVLDAHNERIWIAETSERGTTFTFTLPVRAECL